MQLRLESLLSGLHGLQAGATLRQGPLLRATEPFYWAQLFLHQTDVGFYFVEYIPRKKVLLLVTENIFYFNIVQIVEIMIKKMNHQIRSFHKR